MLCQGRVHRTAEPDRVHRDAVQTRRELDRGPLRLEHVTFPPEPPRPLLLGLVRLENRGSEPLVLEYTETWDLERTGYAVGEAAAIAETPEGRRALADASMVLRARPPAEPPSRGLALDLRIPMPPRARRRLAFAYAAPPPGEDPAPLVRAWRGGVEAELERRIAALRTSH